MYRPRRRTVRRASAKDSVPAATCAEYSPRLCPAANDGLQPARFREPATPQRSRPGSPAACSPSAAARRPGPRNTDGSTTRRAPRQPRETCRGRSGTGRGSVCPIPTFCAPCPGKTNAIMLSVRHGGNLPRQLLEQACRREPRRHGDGVAYRLGRRAAVADDAEPVERRRSGAPPYSARIEPLAEPPERLARQQVAHARAERRRELLVQQVLAPSRRGPR